MRDSNVKTSKLFIGLYIFFIFCAAMGDYKVLNAALGALPKIVSAGAAGIALIFFLKSGNFKNHRVFYRFGLLFSSIITVILICSVLIWILDLQSFDYILKGVSKISYQFLNIVIVLCAVYMFEEKAATYTFFGISAANVMIILIGALKAGISTALSDMIANVTTFGANEVVENSTFIRAIEIHDITFVMGVFIIYFLFFCPHEKYRYLYAGIALFLFFAGLKRIAFLSLFCALAFALFCLLLGPKGKVRTLIAVSLSIVAFCYFYIVVIQNGSFTAFCLEHGIELNGRDKIYEYLSDFFKVSPSYGGKGYEYCVQLLRSMKGTKDQVLNITAVHNDILKMYIEMGFWGFLLWITGYYVFQTHWFISRCGEQVAVCFMTVNVYMLVTYLTDNTMFYYWSSMVIRMIPMCFFFSPLKEAPLKSDNPLYLGRFDRWRYKKRQRDEKERKEPRMTLE